MRDSSQWASLFLSGLLVVILMLPTLQWLTHCIPEVGLYGYTEALPNRPTEGVKDIFNRNWQHWIEAYFKVNSGFRAFFIRTYNELNFILFREADSTRLKLVTTKTHGLYSNLSTDSLNQMLMHKKKEEESYTKEAKKLLAVQQLLEKQGKYFEVVIASSKAYIYPDELGSRYIFGGTDKLFTRAASFGEVLLAHGVHVIDSGPLLRQWVARTGLETHPVSGLHWNYYAACLTANQMFEQARLDKFPTLSKVDCGTPEVRLSAMNDVNVDGYALLNIWSKAGLIKPTTFPTFGHDTREAWRPKIVFIGDSFSEQIRHALTKVNAYSNIVFSSYFQTRDVYDSANNLIEANGIPPERAQVKLLSDINDAEIVILEMVDYNISRMGYGFSDFVLKKIT